MHGLNLFYRILKDYMIDIFDNEIVFYGCSFTDRNSGFVDPDKMYPALMAKYFNQTERNFAKNGCGNYRSFDLIADTNFKNDSIVIIQLTELSRIRHYDKELSDVMLSGSDNKCLVRVYNDDFLMHELTRHLNFITKLCREKNIKLIIWSIASFFNHKYDQMLSQLLSVYPEYVHLDARTSEMAKDTTYRIDNGYDGESKPVGEGHPGPKSHQRIAEKLITKYNQLYTKTG